MEKVLLIIMDGYGLSNNKEGNAICAAKTDHLDDLFSRYPHCRLKPSGLSVGLPEGVMGNSEVGHMNIGAGRIIFQMNTLIDKLIDDGKFYENDALNSAIDHSIKNNSKLHIFGLLSDGNVHSNMKHLEALMRMSKLKKAREVYFHAFMDGRDTLPNSGLDFLNQFLKLSREIGIGKVATISGRYYAMDRDNRWDRVEKAYSAMVKSEGNFNENPLAVMEESYSNNATDEFVIPTVCNKNGNIKSDDSVVFFNFRPDRAREITRTFVDPSFDGFNKKELKLHFVCLTQYDVTMPNVSVAFKPQSLNNTLGEYISNNGLTQLRIAETEKYAHVTFFFNGGVEEPCKNEERILVSSPKVATYDLQPEMSAYEVCDKVVEAIKADKYDVIILNYANCDMVGHTGIFDAAKSAVEAVDKCVGKTVDAILEKGGVALITADHGNADQMCEEDGSPFTAHTTNPVPFIVVGHDCNLRNDGVLADIAPTMLELLNLPLPTEMTGKSIIAK